MKDYSKYINSPGTHYIANSGSDENGAYRGGTAGDQTGKEWQLRGWYARPWTHVCRYPDRRVAEDLANLSCAAALNNNIGYDQGQRGTYWARLKEIEDYDPSKITKKCEEDCSAGVAANIKAVGYRLGIAALQGVSSAMTSRTTIAMLKAAGFEIIKDKKYISGKTYLLPGDVLLCENHHVAVNITMGANAKWQDKPKTEALIAYGSKGDAVKLMQERLLSLRFALPKYGADGDFGSETLKALKSFQIAVGIESEGIYDAATETALRAKCGAKLAIVTGASVYVRDGVGTSANALGTVRKGTELDYLGETSAEGWYKVLYDHRLAAWVSGKYTKIEG